MPNDTHTHTHILGRTPQGEGSACGRDLYLATYIIQNGETSMSPAGFEPEIQKRKWSKIYILDRAATWIGFWINP
jgi:hypothetical protein